jgi:hypothetical protein
MGDHPTLKDVWESILQGEKPAPQLDFIWKFFGDKVMNLLLVHCFENGEELASIPYSGSVPPDEQLLVKGFWSRCKLWTKLGFKRQIVLSVYEKFLWIWSPSIFANSEWVKWQREASENLKIMCLRPPRTLLDKHSNLSPRFP